MIKLKEVVKADPKYIPLALATEGLEIYVRDNTAMAFKARATSKPLWNYRFKSEVERDTYIKNYIAKFELHMIAKKKYKDESKTRRASDLAEFKSKLKPGAILSDSWGYEQTQVEFYKVLEVKGSSVLIVELGHITLEAKSWASCDVMPDLNSTQGEPLWKKVCTNYIPICSSIHLTLWDGKPKYKSWYY